MDISLIHPRIHSPALVMNIDPEKPTVIPTQTGGIFVFRAMVQRGEVWESARDGVQLTLLSLHGIFSRSNASNSTGMSLLPSERLPLNFPMRQTTYPLELHFELSREYVTRFEDERTWQQPGKDTQCAVRLWGTLAIETSDVINGQQLDRFSVIRSDPTVFQIAHSDWLDVLKRMGYPYRRVIELPSVESEKVVPELQEAARHLEAAMQLFTDEHYRDAVNRCRHARDALLGEGKDKVTWARQHLKPVLGEKKVSMVDEGLKALNHLGDVAGHGYTPDIEIDRDSAEYVLGQLAHMLRYIDRKLR